MTFDIACPHCRAEFTVSEQQIGKTARCKQCRETFIITNNEPIVRDLAQTEIENTPTASPTEIPKVEAIVAANTVNTANTSIGISQSLAFGVTWMRFRGLAIAGIVIGSVVTIGMAVAISTPSKPKDPPQSLTSQPVKTPLEILQEQIQKATVEQKSLNETLTALKKERSELESEVSQNQDKLQEKEAEFKILTSLEEVN